MTRKRRKQKNEVERRKKSTESGDSPPLVDLRAMEGIFRRLAARIERDGIGSVSGPIDIDELEPIEPATPLEEAQEVVYRALEASSPGQRVSLAHKALQISEDCADAYVLLAENASTLQEALDLYRQGVAAGQRALGKKVMKEEAGQFWGLIETRPYMRARLGFAETLWAVRQREEAVSHYSEMLRLNPNDNQGVRYLLAHALLDMEEHKHLHKLLESYEDEASAEWAYVAALLAFREEGDSKHSRELLKKAAKANRHVPKYLTGTELLPTDFPSYVSFGGEDEAAVLAGRYLPLWKTTSGATAWVRQTLKIPVRTGKPEPSRSGRQAIMGAVAALPQDGSEAWEVDIRPFPPEIEAHNQALTPWMILVCDAATREVLAAEPVQERPQTATVWKCLLAAMSEPEGDTPHRPGKIAVRLKTFHSAWKSKLAAVGIQCHLSPALESIDWAMNAMRELGAPMVERFAAGASDTSVATPDDLASLPQSAGEIWQADFRQLASWVDVDGEPQRPWVVLVVNLEDHMILGTNMSQAAPDPTELWQCLGNAMRHPGVGKPRRPGAVQLVAREDMQMSVEQLEASGIRAVMNDRCEELDELFADLTEHLAGPEHPKALLDSPGVNPERVGSFFDAAAMYYREAPWRHIPGDTTIRIECDKVKSSPWYGVVMGQMGLELGLALYEDLDVIGRILADDTSEQDRRRGTSALSLMYTEAFHVAPKDLEAAERYRWPVAGPEAYPIVIRINPGMAIRSPLVWELELLEACLRSIPEFVRQSEIELVRTVRVASGEAVVKLSRIQH